MLEYIHRELVRAILAHQKTADSQYCPRICRFRVIGLLV
ncbi:MAG: Uncharacterised protein [Oceanospirillaceae bacterium UBA2001]|nr:MAG: Uncharacterised protein [Oceanospirillaceae bacterium UBA2001]